VVSPLLALKDEKVTVQSNGDSDNNRNHYYDGPSGAFVA
jgi:hypothetical protein